MTEKSELKHRVEAKRKRIEARIAELKADSSAGSREQIEQLRKRLATLDDSLKNGWDRLTEGVAGKLNDWLSRDDA